MSLLGRVLIAGTGPTAVQLAVMLSRWQDSHIGIAGRASLRSAPLFDALGSSGGTVRVDVSDGKLEALSGTCRIHAAYNNYNLADGDWDTLILSVTADAYVAVLS